MSKLKTGRDAALAITAVLEKAHNQEGERLETAHAAWALHPDADVLSTVLKYMVTFFSSHNMYFLKAKNGDSYATYSRQRRSS